MAQRESDLLTHAAYARHREALSLPGATREAVGKAVKEGRISTINGKIHPIIADAEWLKNTRTRLSPQASGTSAIAPAAVAPGDLVAQAAVELAGASQAATVPAAPLADPGYNIHRAKREKADSEIAAMNAAKMAGELVLREDVDRGGYEVGRELRDAIEAMARRTAPEVASLASAEGCEEVLRREGRILCELLVTAFREKLGARSRALA